jgi:hypothetical protein
LTQFTASLRWYPFYLKFALLLNRTSDSFTLKAAALGLFFHTKEFIWWFCQAPRLEFYFSCIVKDASSSDYLFKESTYQVRYQFVLGHPQSFLISLLAICFLRLCSQDYCKHSHNRFTTEDNLFIIYSSSSSNLKCLCLAHEVLCFVVILRFTLSSFIRPTKNIKVCTFEWSF